MNRTTIVLPDDLKAEALKRARVKGISFGALVREALDNLLTGPVEDATQQSRRQAIEAMLRFSEHAPAGPPDLSDRLDDYLYGASKTPVSA
jgi:Arc/MetJ family transcription regulator